MWMGGACEWAGGPGMVRVWVRGTGMGAVRGEGMGMMSEWMGAGSTERISALHHTGASSSPGISD